MPTIPEYKAGIPLDTAKGSMPDPTFELTGLKAMSQAGAALQNLGAHMIARQQQTEDTAAGYAYEDAVMKAKETSNAAVEQNDMPDGTGMTSTGTAAIKENSVSILKTMPKRLQEKYAHKFDILQRTHALSLSDAETQKRYGYHTEQTKKFAVSKGMEVAQDPSKYETARDDLYGLIDGMPITPMQKDALKAGAYDDLAKGKAAGELERDPYKHRRDLGGGGRSANFQKGQYGKPGENLVHLKSSKGINFQVNAAAADDIKGFVDDLEAAGAPVHFIGGFNHRQKVGAKGLSQHSYGTVIDVNQTGRDVVTKDFRDWSNANPEKLKQIGAKHNMVSGGNWKNPDFGHWEWKPPEYRGGAVKTSSGARVPTVKFSSDTQAKQFQYIWHEMTGDTNLGMGASTEKAAYNKITKAKTLSDAVIAGLAYERPSVPHYANRFENAQAVLSGKSTPSAMRARKFFESKGMTAIQASGLVGVLMGESGKHLNPGAYNEDDPGGSVGVGQWNDGKDGTHMRKTHMIAFTKAAKVEPDVPDDKDESYFADLSPETYEDPVVQNEAPGTPDPAYENMSLEWRLSEINKANAKIKSNENDAYVGALARTKEAANDALVSITEHGDAPNIQEPNFDDFLLANKGDGEAAANDYESYQASKRVAQLMFAMKDMNPSEIDGVVEDFKARIPVGEGAAEATALAKQLEAKGKEIKGPKEDELNFEWNMNKVEKGALASLAKDKEDKAKKDLKAAEDARDAIAAAKKKGSFEYAMKAMSAVQDAWMRASAAPGAGLSGAAQPGLTEKAIATTYEAQKHLRIPPSEMQLISPEYVEDNVARIFDDTNDLTSNQRMGLMANIMSLTSDDTQRGIIFNQLKKAGIPHEMKYALSAFFRGDVGAYQQLFNPALVKGLKVVEGTKIKEVKDLARGFIETGIGQAEFGSGIVDSKAQEDSEAAVNLITNYAMMQGGSDMAGAVQRAGKLILGDVKHVGHRFGYGTLVDVTIPGGADDREARAGFNNLTVDVKSILSTMIDPTDPVAQTKVVQAANNGEFRNYGEGYAFRLRDGTYLTDVKTNEIVEWSLDQVTRAAKRPNSKMDSLVSVGRGVGALEKPTAPSGPLEPGNIDLDNRKVVNNADGTISTEHSMSFEEDGVEVLIPQVAEDGSKILNPQEAIAQYKRTGKHLGKFKTAAEADAYAEKLHERQAKKYKK